LGPKELVSVPLELEGDDTDVFERPVRLHTVHFVLLIIVRCDFYILWGIKIIIKKIKIKKKRKKY